MELATVFGKGPHRLEVEKTHLHHFGLSHHLAVRIHFYRRQTSVQAALIPPNFGFHQCFQISPLLRHLGSKIQLQLLATVKPPITFWMAWSRTRPLDSSQIRFSSASGFILSSPTVSHLPWNQCFWLFQPIRLVPIDRHPKSSWMPCFRSSASLSPGWCLST